jgi:hypothetical protein
LSAFCWDKRALSLQFAKITLHFPKLQRETGLLRTANTANQSRVFWLSHGFTNAPQEARKSAEGRLSASVDWQVCAVLTEPGVRLGPILRF